MRFTSAQQIILFTVVSWLGEYVHNRFDLPQLTLLSYENSYICYTPQVTVLDTTRATLAAHGHIIHL